MREIFVNRSPPREPKALETPTQPKAPARPRPLPRWIRTSRIRKMLTISTRTFKNVDPKPGPSSNTVDPLVLICELRNPERVNHHYRIFGEARKDDFSFRCPSSLWASG